MEEDRSYGGYRNTSLLTQGVKACLHQWLVKLRRCAQQVAGHLSDLLEHRGLHRYCLRSSSHCWGDSLAQSCAMDLARGWKMRQVSLVRTLIRRPDVRQDTRHAWQ